MEAFHPDVARNRTTATQPEQEALGTKPPQVAVEGLGFAS